MYCQDVKMIDDSRTGNLSTQYRNTTHPLTQLPTLYPNLNGVDLGEFTCPCTSERDRGVSYVINKTKRELYNPSSMFRYVHPEGGSRVLEPPDTPWTAYDYEGCTEECHPIPKKIGEIEVLLKQTPIPGEGSTTPPKIEQDLSGVSALSGKLGTLDEDDEDQQPAEFVEIDVRARFREEGIFKDIFESTNPSSLPSLNRVHLSIAEMADLKHLRGCPDLVELNVTFPSWFDCEAEDGPMEVLTMLAKDSRSRFLRTVILNMSFTPTAVSPADTKSFDTLFERYLPG